VKLAASRARLVRLQFAQPLRTARGTFTTRSSVLFELRDQDGVTGHGEAAPWPGFATESADEAYARLREAAPLLAGAEPDCGEGSALATLLHDAPAARAALQGARWDLAARRAGRPLAVHLAACRGDCVGPVLPQVPVSVLLIGSDPDALQVEAAQARSAGHRAVKLKLGVGPLAADVARARAVRAAIGPEVLLRGDANGAWDAATAAAALEALAEFGFDYVEQPLPAADISGLAALRRRAPVRLAADESVADAADALRLFAAEAVDVAVLKPAVLGGAARALEIANRARAAGVAVVFSHVFESAIGARHVLHCAAAWGDATAVHGLCTVGAFVADVAAPVGCRGGMAELPDTPGIGELP